MVYSHGKVDKYKVTHICKYGDECMYLIIGKSYY